MVPKYLATKPTSRMFIMPSGRTKTRKNFTISPEVVDEFSRLVPNMSQEVGNLIRSRIAELTGRKIGGNAEAEYRTLKEQYDELADSFARRRKVLRENTVLYNQANELFRQLGIEPEEFCNLPEIVPKFMKAWTEDREYMHLFVSQAELRQKKKQLEHRLEEMRLAKTANPGYSTLVPTTALVSAHACSEIGQKGF